MSKTLVLLLFFFFLCQQIFSQKISDITIQLSNDINAKELILTYYNGKKNVVITDSFTNNILKLKAAYYSALSSLQADCKDTRYIFLLNEQPAQITFQANPDFKYEKIVNAMPVFDSNYNPIFKELNRYRAKESKAWSDFLDKNGSTFTRSDSLLRENRKLLKALVNKVLVFLKKYPNEYYSFWYFREQVVTPSVVFLSRDTSYMQSMLTYFQTTFPKKYTESEEGKRLFNQLQGLAIPTKVNTPLPKLTMKDINGNDITLSDLKGRYVLLDFWATWCPPCMAQMPFIKKLSTDFPPEKLVIIGISEDRSYDKLKSEIVKSQMNWKHVFDEDNQIEQQFGINAIPTTILINKEGIITYFHTGGGKDSQETLLKLLQ